MNGNGDEGEERRPPPPPSDEQPIVVVGVDDDSDERPALEARAEGGGLADAYATLEIRTPPEELDAFARGRVEALARLGQTERAALAQEALRVAQGALRRVMGALPREAP